MKREGSRFGRQFDVHRHWVISMLSRLHLEPDHHHHDEFDGAGGL